MSCLHLHNYYDRNIVPTQMQGNDSVKIVLICTITAVPDSPQLPNTRVSATCHNVNGNQVTLQWTPPTNTGGQGVEIERYLLTVTGPVGFTCPPSQCSVTANTTTITGLQCGTSYMVTVRAVNCIGESRPSEPVEINTPNIGK